MCYQYPASDETVHVCTTPRRSHAAQLACHAIMETSEVDRRYTKRDTLRLKIISEFCTRIIVLRFNGKAHLQLLSGIRSWDRDISDQLALEDCCVLVNRVAVEYLKQD